MRFAASVSDSTSRLVARRSSAVAIASVASEVFDSSSNLIAQT
ncbi:hypothetical protein ACFQMM_20110 [Saliphagus sp. GCM10025308]